MRAIRFFLLLLVMLATCQPLLAQNDTSVGVVSLVWGEVTVKHENEDYKPARWLEPIFPGDMVKTSGPGSKLLLTFFSDNHQEVMGSDNEATVGQAGLVNAINGAVRVDGPRNPFGAGGVESPFIYTRKLVQADFANAANANLEAEKAICQGRVRPSFPPNMFWGKQADGVVSTFRVFDYLGAPLWTRQVKGHSYQMSEKEANAMPKGVIYNWDVMAGDQVVVARYPFKLLTKPQRDWYLQQRAIFDKKKTNGKLERSDWTDMCLMASQLLYVDEALDLLYKMGDMDPQNPNIQRALVRVYLMKGCPGLAKQALDKELELGGVDPINL